MVDRETCGKAVESLSPRGGRQTELDGARLSQFGQGARIVLGKHVDRAVVDSNPAVGATLPGGSSMLTPASACVTEPAGKSFKPAGAGG